jgi:hypothetical protein
MAVGDVTLYSKLLQAEADQTTLSSMPLDYDTDTLKMMILDVNHTPDNSDTTSQEHLDDVDADEVSTTAGYTGPITLTTVTVTTLADVISINLDNVQVTADGSGFTDGRYAVVYKDSGSPATSPLICTIDLGSSVSIAINDLQFNWGSGKLFTKSKT